MLCTCAHINRLVMGVAIRHASIHKLLFVCYIFAYYKCTLPWWRYILNHHFSIEKYIYRQYPLNCKKDTGGKVSVYLVFFRVLHLIFSSSLLNIFRILFLLKWYIYTWTFQTEHSNTPSSKRWYLRWVEDPGIWLVEQTRHFWWGCRIVWTKIN